MTEYFEEADFMSSYTSALFLNRNVSRLYLAERFMTLRKEGEKPEALAPQRSIFSDLYTLKSEPKPDLVILNREEESPSVPPTAIRVVLSGLFDAKLMRLYEELDSFIVSEIKVGSEVAAEIRRAFFATMKTEKGEKMNLKKQVALLKGIILAANRIGDAIQNELAR